MKLPIDPLHNYLLQLADSVKMPDAEYAREKALANALIHQLQRVLPEFESIKIYGSFSRRTSLKRAIDSKTDIDLFLIETQESYTAKEVADQHAAGAENFEDFYLQRLCQRIADGHIAGPADVQLDQPSIDIRYEDVQFQVSPARKAAWYGEGLYNYVFNVQLSSWEMNNDALMERYIGPGIFDAFTNKATLYTDPFMLQEILYKLGEDHAAIARSLILVLKYWKQVNHLPIASYIIEWNVLKAFAHIFFEVEVEEKSSSTFSFLYTIFKKGGLYHHELFDGVPAFVVLQHALEESMRYIDHDELVKALPVLQSVLPLPL